MDILEKIIEKLKQGNSIKSISEELNINRHSISLVKRMLTQLEEKEKEIQSKEREITKLKDENLKLKNENINIKSQINNYKTELDKCKTIQKITIYIIGLLALTTGFLIGKIIHLLGG